MIMILNYITASIRIAAYVYVAWSGWMMTKNNGDIKIVALGVSSGLVAMILLLMTVVKVFAPSVDMALIRSIGMTPIVVFWGLAHLYVLIKKG